MAENTPCDLVRSNVFYRSPLDVVRQLLTDSHVGHSISLCGIITRVCFPHEIKNRFLFARVLSQIAALPYFATKYVSWAIYAS